jgi:TatD DNase family protein
MIDTHCHLCDKRFDKDREAVLVRAQEAGVTHLVEIAYAPELVAKAHALAREHAHVYLCVGVHPSESGRVLDDYLPALRDHARHPRVVAIGETGLDCYRDYAPRADQERAFHAQIDLARATSKPLVIHTRAAEDDTVETLKARAHGLQVIMHCFSMPDRLDECLAEGWWISFAGNVTYPKATDLAEAAERVPDDRLLVETDAPYLTPQVVRKERNQPAFVTHTARFVAERRGVAYEELERLVEANAATLFAW